MANWLGFHQLYNEAFEVRFGLFAQFHHCIASETELFSSLKYQSTHTTHRRDYFQSFYPDRSEAGMGGQKWKKKPSYMALMQAEASASGRAKAEAHFVK